jgi:hypothetical protein
MPEQQRGYMQFIDRARQTHGDKFDYSKVNYINTKTKVNIICYVHGSFYQTPENHWVGKGCPYCKFDKIGDINRLSLEDFIKKSTLMHGDKYDYSKVDYKSTRTKVIIICPVHGQFEQMPLHHFNYGCKQCGVEISHIKTTKTTANFIEQVKIVHKSKYDYSESVYVGAHIKINIICPTHGMFEQTPNSHLRGRGCPECKKGKNHPRYGKPNPGSAYAGEYNGTMFRSLPELFWIIDCEKQGIRFLGLDQGERRQFWQVEVDYAGRPATYCADFYIYDTNEVIEIKPRFKQIIMAEKLRQGAIEYEKRGYKFKIINTENIKIKPQKFKTMVNNQIVKLYPASLRRFDNRFSK